MNSGASMVNFLCVCVKLFAGNPSTIDIVLSKGRTKCTGCSYGGIMNVTLIFL